MHAKKTASESTNIKSAMKSGIPLHSKKYSKKKSLLFILVSVIILHLFPFFFGNYY